MALSKTGVIVEDRDESLRSFMLNVYTRLCFGILVTAISAFVATLPPVMSLLYHVDAKHHLVPTFLGWAVTFAPLALILMIRSIGGKAAYWAITVLFGLMFAPILTAYTGASIAIVFALTALMFGLLSIFGYTTKINLGPIGTFLFFSLFGLIGLMVVGIFIPMPRIWIDLAGVVIFSGFIAYDTQQMKDNFNGNPSDEETVYGAALNLYLDALNLFIFLLEICGIKSGSDN